MDWPPKDGFNQFSEVLGLEVGLVPGDGRLGGLIKNHRAHHAERRASPALSGFRGTRGSSRSFRCSAASSPGVTGAFWALNADNGTGQSRDQVYRHGTTCWSVQHVDFIDLRWSCPRQGERRTICRFHLKGKLSAVCRTCGISIS